MKNAKFSCLLLFSPLILKIQNNMLRFTWITKQLSNLTMRQTSKEKQGPNMYYLYFEGEELVLFSFHHPCIWLYIYTHTLKPTVFWTPKYFALLLPKSLFSHRHLNLKFQILHFHQSVKQKFDLTITDRLFLHHGLVCEESFKWNSGVAWELERR